ncbi:MAG TPA: DUF6186 family protein [Acidimicrobiales bacterium]|nr:DUF6186 family protein [Acidimicrobiales bacterium]
MLGDLAWAAILTVAVALETGARLGARWPTLDALAARISSARAGRIALYAAWLFVGLHLFARYTVPR